MSSDNKPFVVWEDKTPGNWDIFFSKWNGSAWTKGDGLTPGPENISNNGTPSTNAKIRLSSDNKPFIVWEDTNIYFTKWNGTNWTCADGVTPGHENISNAVFLSSEPQMELTTDNKPNVIWNSTEVYFTKWDSGAWRKANGALGYEDISNTTGNSINQRFKLSSDGKPNIIWQDDTPGNYDIFFTKWNSSVWTKADSTTLGHDNLSNTTSDSYYPEMDLTSDNRPMVVWEERNSSTNYEVYFTNWNGSAWTKANGTTPGWENLSNTSDYSEEPKIEVSSDNKPYITWKDGLYDIKFTKWNGTSWTKADGFTPGCDFISLAYILKDHPQMKLSSNNLPFVVYEGAPSDWDILFSRWSGYLSNKQAQSKKINTANATINKATLTASHNLNGGAINYFLSANGGINWEPVTTGVEHTFTHQGNDLRWKAVLSTTNPNRTPLIDSLNINYSVADNQGPTGSIVINSGETYTHSRTVPLLLQAQDNVEIYYMIVSNDPNFTGASWDAWESSKTWTLTEGDGEKTVYVRYKDLAGNTSPVYSDSIYLVTKKSLERLYGDTRYETAVAISQKGWLNGAATVVVARGDLFPDALAGAALAYKSNGPILLTNSVYLTESTQKEVSRLKAKNVYILGTEDAVSKKVETDLEEKCSIAVANIKRLGGDTRYDTAAAIAHELGSPANKTAIIATGENYPDALAAASISAFKGMPILLVRGDIGQVPSPTEKALIDLGIKSAVITGQEDVVPTSIKEKIESMQITTTRFGGNTRYDTCYQIADWALKNQGMDKTAINIAVGENFPDALTIGPLAAKKKSVVVLVREFIPSAINDFLNSYKDVIYLVYIAGGPDVVSTDVENQIKKVLGI